MYDKTSFSVLCQYRSNKIPEIPSSGKYITLCWNIGIEETRNMEFRFCVSWFWDYPIQNSRSILGACRLSTQTTKSKPDWSVCCWTLGLPNRFCCPKTEEIGGYDQHQYRKQVQQSEPRYNSQDTRLINVVIIKRIGLIIRCSWSTLAN